MLTKIKNSIIMAATSVFLFANQALAEGPLPAKSPEELGTKIKEFVEKVGMPVGGGLLFFSVVIIAIKLIVTSSNAKKRTEVMEGFMYIGIAGVVLGGSLFFAGIILGAGESFK